MKFLSAKALSVLGMIVALATSGCDSASSKNDAAGSGNKRTITSGSTTIVVEEHAIDPAMIEQMKQLSRDELEQMEKRYYDNIVKLVNAISKTKKAAENPNASQLLDGIPMMEQDIATNKKMWAAIRTSQEKSTTFPSEFAVK